MIKYEHLLHKEFVYGKQDCYKILLDFYADNFGIKLPNFARPSKFWEKGLNIYMNQAAYAGFSPLHCHPSEYQVGDVFMCAINSEVVNHIAILVDGGKVIHHLWNRLSEKDNYRGLLRNTTMAVMRHKDVRPERVVSDVNILDLVPASVRRKIDAAAAGLV